MNNRWTFFIALAFLTTIVACVVPGLPSASAPAPTVDTGILATMVAETVSAAIALTEQAFPTPTLVPTSEATSTPTLIPAPEIVSPGSTLTMQEDGFTLFMDERAGYKITVPKGWLAVRVNEPEYLDALTLSPDIQKFLLSIQNNDPNTFRLSAIDTQDGHFQDGFFTNINFIWDEQNAALLKNDDGLRAGTAQFAGAAPEPGILSTTLSTTASGISVIVVESKSILKDPSNKELVVFQKQVIFNTRTGAMVVTVSTVEGLKETIFAAFDAMIETVKVNAE